MPVGTTKKTTAGRSAARGRHSSPRRSAQPLRPVWANRFATPSVPALVHALKHIPAGAVRHARTEFMAVPGMEEQVLWQGVWRWTLVYTHPSLPGHVWAFLVPDPIHPVICLPFHESVLAALDDRRLTRIVREGLTNAPVVAGVRWATWPLTGKALVDVLRAAAMVRVAGVPLVAPPSVAARRAS